MALGYYRALLVQDHGDAPDAGYGVVFPDLPGCTSAGETRMEAAKQAADALAGHVALLVEIGDALPEPSDFGAPLPDWLDGSNQVVAEVLVPVEMPGRAVRANITVDEALLRRIDGGAQASGSTRSGFLAEAARDWFRNHQRDWAEKRAADLHRQLEMLRSGKLRSFEKKGAREVDTTARDIERIEGWLSELATLPAKVSAGDAP
jgi:predicted RNase H-like HicB family nuclease